MTNIEDLAKNVYQNTDGIYYANSISKVSYPEDGNEKTFLLEENSFWFRHRNKVIIKAIKKYADGMHFFDIGGGNGYVAKGVQENNQDVTLVEPGIQGAQVAKKRGIKSVLCSTLDDAGFKPSSMETAGMFDVVEHVENDIDFLENIHGYLKESSRVFITVPAYNFLWSKEDVDAGHYRRYTLKSLKKVVTKAGFTPLYTSYFFSPLVIPIFLFRSLPSRLGFNKNSDDIEKYKKEHKEGRGFLSRLLDLIWKWELERISSAKRIPFGSSCFIIAQKNK